MSGEAVSHGRGGTPPLPYSPSAALTNQTLGTGNIGPDSTTYVDGEIVRQGDPAADGGAYSAGVQPPSPPLPPPPLLTFTSAAARAISAPRNSLQ